MEGLAGVALREAQDNKSQGPGHVGSASSRSPTAAIKEQEPSLASKKYRTETARHEHKETQPIRHHPPLRHRTGNRTDENLANISDQLPTSPQYSISRLHHHPKNHIFHTRLSTLCISLMDHFAAISIEENFRQD